MDKIDNAVLLNLLKNDGVCVYATESNTMEFKSDFAWSDRAQRAKYCKSMAAMCNNEGGYLLFGIEDATGRILGVNNFDAVDAAVISDHLNNYFSPAFNFHKTSIEVSGRRVGVIYIEKYKDIPTICIKAYETILKDGALFYRYPGKSDFISGTDLIHLLHQLRGKEGKELTNLKKIELKQAALPILQANGGSSYQHTFSFKVRNLGKRAKIESITITKGNINIFQHSFPKWIEQNQELQIEGANIDGMVMSMVAYELEIHYSDTIGTKYLILGSGKGAHLKFGDAVEVT